MLSFVVRRLLLTIPVLVGVATLVFSLIHLIPGDPVQAMLGESAAPNDVAALRERLGLNRPLPVQYIAFLAGATSGDLGRSLRTNQDVTREIATRIPATFELAMASMVVAIGLAVPLGIIAAVRRGTAIDRAATTVALIGVSVPGFWLGPLSAILFSVWLGWLPVSGRGTLAHLVLPACTLGLPLAAVLTKTIRASLIDELGELYVLAARARGLSASQAVVHHALPNSLIPVVTVVGLQFGVVLTGAVITETIFAWPGVGRFLVQSIGARDYPAVQGCILFIAVVYVAMNLLIDLSYGWLDPRIRYE
jgi:ABC-type dipeptide/oligopeptide/nickel transport system permease component